MTVQKLLSVTVRLMSLTNHAVATVAGVPLGKIFSKYSDTGSRQRLGGIFVVRIDAQMSFIKYRKKKST